MLGVGTIPPLCVTKTTINFPIFFIRPELQHNYAPLTLLRRTGFCLFAQKKQQKSSISKIELEREDFDDGFGVDEDEADYDEFDEDLFDNIDDEGDDDDDDEVMVPLDKMDAWLEKKPKGFGEGKVYDTSVEDKLLIELEKIREAQVANIEKLKNQAKVADPKKVLKKEVKVSEITPGCVRVRITNLPKKKNIQRDLKSAFEGVRGIANILPMVSGTKKTRDPVCKGFAFVDFKSLEDADRFVQLFSGQNISFGKMEKRIKCDILKLGDDGNVGSVREAHNIVSKSRISILEEERNGVDDVGEHNPQLNSSVVDDFDEFDEDSDDEVIMGKFKLLNSTETSDIESAESRLLKQSFVSSLTKQKEKRAGKKTPAVKKKLVKATKAKVPGSMHEIYNSISKPKITALGKEGYQVHDIGEHDPQLDSLEDDDFDDLDEDEDDEDVVVNFELLNSMERGDIGSIESRLLKQSFDPLPTKQKVKKVGKTMPEVKKKPDNATKAKAPGSMPEIYNIISKSKITALRKAGDQFHDIGEDEFQIDSLEDDDFDDLDEDEDDEDIVVNLELLNSMERGDIKSIESRLLKKSFDPLPTKHKEVGKKMPAVEKKPNKVTKVNGPGSMHEKYNISKSKITSVGKEGDQVENEHDVDIVESVELLNSMKQTFDPWSTKQKEKRVNKKKSAVKKKPDNATKIKLPGSSKRLKVQEKAKLADVYSKYAAREEATASKEM